VLDPALLRPGRFDRRIVVNRPDVKGREGILASTRARFPMSDDCRVPVLARGHGRLLRRRSREPGERSGAERRALQPEDRADARLRVRQGQGADGIRAALDDHQRREKRVTAIHEAGHALLTVLLPHADPIHKVTIIPRGMALGSRSSCRPTRSTTTRATT
jgi:cell division protease FtsH